MSIGACADPPLSTIGCNIARNPENTQPEGLQHVCVVSCIGNGPFPYCYTVRQVKTYNLDLLVAFGGMLRSIVLASKMCSPGNQSDLEDELALNIGHKYFGASISALESNT